MLLFWKESWEEAPFFGFLVWPGRAQSAQSQSGYYPGSRWDLCAVLIHFWCTHSLSSHIEGACESSVKFSTTCFINAWFWKGNIIEIIHLNEWCVCVCVVSILTLLTLRSVWQHECACLTKQIISFYSSSSCYFLFLWNDPVVQADGGVCWWGLGLGLYSFGCCVFVFQGLPSWLPEAGEWPGWSAFCWCEFVLAVHQASVPPGPRAAGCRRGCCSPA